MGVYLDLTNKRFGRLVALERDISSKRTKWICKCDCGNIKSVQVAHLRSGATISCGCYHKEINKKVQTIHGMTRSSLHNRWKAIKQRCLNENSKSYKNYGGRGIKVCHEWLEFENFYKWSIENGYDKKLQLDRIDNNKGYSPDNCRWAKPIINNHNRRITAVIDGMPLRDFSIKHDIKYSLVHSRYYLLKKKGKEINTHNILTYANQLPNR